ncbi:MAG: DegT/DnrJ/EryC1/StrS family aminotransferase [Pseudomonadota bacterium]
MTSPDTPFLSFALPDIGEEEIAEVVDTLRSGWVTTGPKCQRFEAAFKAFLGNPQLEVLAVNSATAGLHLALEALGVGPGDEVITTTHTFTATAEVVRYLGADVVLVDIDPQTLCIDVDAVARAITPRTKVILPVHFAGRAADMPGLLTLARQHGLHVVEDAAHALPTTCQGQLVGTLASDATVFSFYANKTITTGEGGMVVTRQTALAQRMKTMRLHGMNRDAFDRFTAKVPSWHYDIVAPGFKYNLTDIAAALGIHQLRRLPAFSERRALIAQRYNAAWSDLPVHLPPGPSAGDVHAWHLYVLRLAKEAPVDRQTVIERLYAQGIGCSVHYIPLHLQTYWRERYDLKTSDFPHSQAAFEQMLSVPLYTRMTDTDVERVVQAVRAAITG